jgi:hypothetical protein
MLVLATFMTFCVVAVVFLIGFLFAVRSDIQAARNRPRTRIEPLSDYPAQRGSHTRDPVPALTLVHSNSRRVDVSHPAFTDASVPPERVSQYKGA